MNRIGAVTALLLLTDEIAAWQAQLPERAGHGRDVLG